MGGGSWSSAVYSSHVHSKGLTTSKVSVNADGTIDKDALYLAAADLKPDEIFTNHGISKALDPKKAKVRESRDSEEHPLSNAIILGLDNTGSMGFIAKAMAQQSLPILMQEIYKRKPVTDPQVMFMGINDNECLGHFQVSQFESDIRIAEQLQELWLEGGGGGNEHESYSMAWYFAANHTSIDCWEKRSQKGFLFTIGDEMPDPYLSKEQLYRILGYMPEGGASLDCGELLKKAQKRYHVFHVVVEEGTYARSNKSEVRTAWKQMLGNNVILLADHTKLAEVVVSAIQIAAGADPDEVSKSWDGSTAAVVAAAVKDIKRVVEA